MFKTVCTTTILLFAFCYGVVLLGNESSTDYFPNTLDSYWVYEDQDGNEFTRRAVEGEEIAGEMYHAFEYEPEFEKWEDYDYHVHPTLFKVDETGIKFHIGDKIRKAYTERLTKELESSFENSRQNLPDEAQFEPKIDVKIDSQDNFYLLPFPITLNEEWDTIRIKPTFRMTMNIANSENDPELSGASYTSNIYFTIMEVGNILAKETVETPAGKFDDCLKIEYRTETVMPKLPGGGQTAGESVTTLWLAPNVGIVKFHQESERPILQGTFPAAESTTQEKTFELKEYEIKPDAVELE